MKYLQAPQTHFEHIDAFEHVFFYSLGVRIVFKCVQVLNAPHALISLKTTVAMVLTLSSPGVATTTSVITNDDIWQNDNSRFTVKGVYFI